MSATSDRVPRLLALVPYLQARPGIRLAAAAADLDVSEAQLRADLELLWMCGLPGHGPGDLIDLAFEGDTVTVTFDAGIQRPLRLTGDEALALVIALRTLAAVPGLADRDALEQAQAKIEAAAGRQVTVADGVSVAPAGPDAREPAGDERALSVVRQGLEQSRALDLTYYVAGRDETTQRTVDPMRLLLVDGHSYLEAWCRQAEDVRLFRLDRVDAARILDEPAAAPERAVPRDVTEGVFRPAPEHAPVTLRLGPRARWVADYYPCERVTDVDGGLEVVLRVADTGWVRRLLLGLGAEAVVVDPPALADEVRDEAATALDAYGAYGQISSPS